MVAVRSAFESLLHASQFVCYETWNLVNYMRLVLLLLELREPAAICISVLVEI
ncbi:hypothetical protein XNC1_3151 [Xenorhabdus nematophila ATCC 19061]|uniref:Uncharacterized protein n=1 Tax=Xenorhabdus nematophila (strain ATCC 19061 / DSM 3370 / CCUG 14189 / LMG 1036 / NCIMB 9965 / AN6) TaxID=406817 RepID=D3VKU5_XENNA|nr:hypothetical protein XNC1_3151 [Xenorhabdus nematophila ATCC 19061]